MTWNISGVGVVAPQYPPAPDCHRPCARSSGGTDLSQCSRLQRLQTAGSLLGSRRSAHQGDVGWGAAPAWPGLELLLGWVVAHQRRDHHRQECQGAHCLPGRSCACSRPPRGDGRLRNLGRGSLSSNRDLGGYSAASLDQSSWKSGVLYDCFLLFDFDRH